MSLGINVVVQWLILASAFLVNPECYISCLVDEKARRNREKISV